MPNEIKVELMDACACLLTRALLSFRRWGDETPQAGRFFAIFAALLVELRFSIFRV